MLSEIVGLFCMFIFYLTIANVCLGCRVHARRGPRVIVVQLYTRGDVVSVIRQYR